MTEEVIFRYDSTHIYPAVITKVLYDNVVNLVAFSAINEERWWLYWLWMWCKIGRCAQVFTIMVEQ